jgi:curved DNA-binding protein CbpA
MTAYKFFKFRPDQTITIEAIKKQYHKLALQWHPDRPNGDLTTMQQINAEFDKLRKLYYNVHESQNGFTYTDEAQTATDDVTANFVDIIDQLIKMEGVMVEICGSFIWLGGNTYEHKAEIKSLGFKWASKKKKWFLAPKDWKKKGRRELTMQEIRENYGSRVVSSATNMTYALTA